MKQLLFLFLSITVFAQKPKAIVILVDGIPYDVIQKLKPKNLYQIAQKGGLAPAYVGGERGGATESPTISAVGYNSMLTGVWTNKHNVWGNGIEAPNYKYPTFFKVARDQKPKLKLGIFSTWLDNRTKLLGEGLPQTNHLKMDFAFDGYELDTVNFPHQPDKKYIKDIDELVTDDMGHRYGDSEPFYRSVYHADSLIGEVYKAIVEHEKTTKEKWLLIVTTDHGRDAKTGKNHGGQSDRERITWICTNQPKTNERFRNGLAIVDIFPSVCQFMKINIPDTVKKELEGRSFLK